MAAKGASTFAEGIALAVALGFAPVKALANTPRDFDAELPHMPPHDHSDPGGRAAIPFSDLVRQRLVPCDRLGGGAQ